MKSLSEKYRPQTLAEIRGQSLIVRQLASFVRNPVSKCFIFHGTNGTGKTSAALAMANELCGGADAWHGVTSIPSGELNAETIRDLRLNTLAQHTWQGTGWKVIIADEADNLHSQAEFCALSIMENLPAKVVLIFTTNNAEKFTPRFKSRCEVHCFKTPVKDFGQGDGGIEQAAQSLIDDVWEKELGHNHSPRLADLDGWREGGNLSFRSVLSALEPLVRLQREDDELAAIKAAEIPVAPVALPGGRKSAIAEMEAARAMLATA